MRPKADSEAAGEDRRDTPQETMISRLALRSMKQAQIYAGECMGISDWQRNYYTHFTSPIRRYPDLQIHRIIKDDLRGRNEREERWSIMQTILPEVTRQCK